MEEKISLGEISRVAGPDVMTAAYDFFTGSKKAVRDIDKFMEHYFTSPKTVFGGRSLYEVCKSEEDGQEEVIQYFGRLEHNILQ